MARTSIRLLVVLTAMLALFAASPSADAQNGSREPRELWKKFPVEAEASPARGQAGGPAVQAARGEGTAGRQQSTGPDTTLLWTGVALGLLVAFTAGLVVPGHRR